MAKLLWDEDGSVLTEYGLLVVIIALSLIVVLGLFRDTLKQKFQEIINSIQGVKVAS